MEPDEYPIELKLSSEIQEEVERLLLNRCEEAVDAAQSRDNWLLYFDDLLNMRTGLSQNRRWKGACNLDDPLTREIHYSQVAELSQALRRDPKVQIEAVDEADEDEARRFEQMLQDADTTFDTEDRLNDLAPNACRDFAGVSFQAWRQSVKRTYSDVHLDPETGAEVDPDALEPGADFVSEKRAEETGVYDGIETRTPDLADISLFPPPSTTFDNCLGVFERRLM